MAISAHTLDFLFENRIQDSREWYDAHKPEYKKYVLEPMIQLVEKLQPTMLELDPHLVTEAKVDRCISRIYRDTRFSNDKSRYRDVMWCVFSRDKKLYSHPPGFVLEFSPRGFRYGCGYYSVPPKVMESIRKLIMKDDKAYLAAQKALDQQDVFRIEGEEYKRPHFPDQSEKKRQWLERKCLALMHNSEDFELLFSEDLYLTLAEDFRKLKPVYEFFCKSMECVSPQQCGEL